MTDRAVIADMLDDGALYARGVISVKGSCGALDRCTQSKVVRVASQVKPNRINDRDVLDQE